jgi:hypothetical protein
MFKENKLFMMMCIFSLALIIMAWTAGERNGAIKQCKKLGGELVYPLNKCVRLEYVNDTQQTQTLSIPTMTLRG